MEYYSAIISFITENPKTILGGIGVLIGLVGYVFYWNNIIFQNGNKPSLFTWVPIAIIISFGFYAQIESGAMWGAAATGITALNSTALALYALFCKKTKPEWNDWVCFIGALAAIIWWRISHGLILPVIIVSTADIIAFYPTWKRGRINPFRETVWMWILSFLKFFFAIAALGAYSITTLIFPLCIALVNGTFVVIILTRRMYLSKRGFIH